MEGPVRPQASRIGVAELTEFPMPQGGIARPEGSRRSNVKRVQRGAEAYVELRVLGHGCELNRQGHHGIHRRARDPDDRAKVTKNVHRQVAVGGLTADMPRASQPRREANLAYLCKATACERDAQGLAGARLEPEGCAFPGEGARKTRTSSAAACGSLRQRLFAAAVTNNL